MCSRAWVVALVVLLGWRALEMARADEGSGSRSLSVAELVGRLDDPETQDQAADELRELGEAAVPGLLAALGNSEGQRRAVIVTVLGRIRAPQTREALEGCLSDDSPLVRRQAALALGSLAEAKASEALIAALGDRDPQVRAYAAFALGELADGQAVPSLLSLLSDDAEQVRDYAAVALGRLKDVRSAPALLWLLAHDPSPYVRAHSALALGELGAQGVCGGLLVALEDPSDLVRRRAHRALGLLSDQSFPFSSRTSALVRKGQVARWKEWYEANRETLGVTAPVSPRELARRLASTSTDSTPTPLPVPSLTAVTPPAPRPAPSQQPDRGFSPSPTARRAFDSGTSALAAGDFSAARHALGQAVSAAPQWPDAHYNLAVAHLQSGQRREAVQELRLATTLAPDDGEAWSLLGALLWGEGDLGEARQALERAAGSPDVSTSTLFNLAAVTLELRDYDASARCFGALEGRGFEGLPNGVRGEAHLRAGIAFYHAGDVQRARTHLQKAQSQGVSNPLLEVYLGHACRRAGAGEEAMGHYRAALAAGVRDAPMLSHLAGLLMARGEYEEAEPLLRDLVGRQRADAQAWQRLGLCLTGLGKAAEAREALARALELRPGDESIHSALGHLALSEGDAEAALKEFRALVRAHPDDGEAHCNLGLALRAWGKEREAEEHLKAAAELAPGEVRYRVALAELYLSTNRVSEAIHLAEEAVKQGPRVAGHHALLAKVYLRAGKPREALMSIDRALLLEPENEGYARKRLQYLAALPEDGETGPQP